VPKSADAEVATLTFPDALTLDWTVPYATVAVRCAAELDAVPPRNPYTESSPNTIAIAASNPRPP
jgi:hypothetical protein